MDRGLSALHSFTSEEHGMSYIDREYLLDHVESEEWMDSDGEEHYHEYIPLSIVRNAPAADVRPAVRGRWKTYNNTYICSACGRPVSFWQSKFCPNCGASMVDANG